jgi:hypothetical protein
MKVTDHPKCDATWTGTTVEHCTACHQTFSGTTTGDKHRVGAHGVTQGPDRRRCLTVPEMRALAVAGGKLKDRPYYIEDKNAYGTVIWRRYRPDLPARELRGKDSNERTGPLGTRVPERVSDPLSADYEEAA